MDEDFIKTTTSSISIKKIKKKKNFSLLNYIKSKEIHPIIEDNKIKSKSVGLIDFRRLPKLEIIKKEIMVLNYVTYYFNKFDYIVMYLIDILKDVENIVNNVNVEIIKKSKSIIEKKNKSTRLLKMLTNFSYKFTGDSKTSSIKRSISPVKTRKISWYYNEKEINLSFKNNNKTLKKISSDFRQKPFIPLLKFLKKIYLSIHYLNMIETMLIRKHYDRQFIEKSSLIKSGYKTKIRKQSIKLKKIDNLFKEKEALSEKLYLKQSSKITLSKHFEELFSLERNFNVKKRELINKIDKFKFLLELKIHSD